MLFFVGHVFPYIAVAVFVGGMAWRTADWLRRPVPFPLALDLGGGGVLARVAAIARELLLFDSVFRSDRRLWLWAGLMHASLAAILFGHVVGIASVGRQFTWIGVSAATSVALSAALGVLFGLVFVVSVVALLFRRRAVPEVRTLSIAADWFDLALLLAIAITGLLTRIGFTDPDLAAVRFYLGTILTLDPADLPHRWMFITHFALVCVLLTYFPFSKLVHLTGGLISRGLVAPPVRPRPHVSPGPTSRGRAGTALR